MFVCAHDDASQVKARGFRGDSTLILAAWDARRDTTLIGDRQRGVVLVGRLVARMFPATPRQVGDAGVADLTDELGALKEVRRRMRMGSRDEIRRVALSDLLLWRADRRVADIGAFRTTRSRASFRYRGSWACTGRHTGYSPWKPVRFTLTVDRLASAGFGAAERLRVADRTTGLRIEWQEVPQRTNGIAGRGVRVDVSRLRAGRYRMQLMVNAGGDPSAVATREIDVR
jgi:hypothetical protein